MALLDDQTIKALDRVFRGKGFIKTSTLAKFLDVSSRIVQKWVYDGKIEYVDKTIGGQYRFSRANTEKIIVQYFNGELLGDPVKPNTQQLLFPDLEPSFKK